MIGVSLNGSAIFLEFEVVPGPPRVLSTSIGVACAASGSGSGSGTASGSGSGSVSAGTSSLRFTFDSFFVALVVFVAFAAFVAFVALVVRVGFGGSFSILSSGERAAFRRVVR